MKKEIVTAAQLRFHSYFVESEEIQKVMRKASDDLERLAVQKTVTVPVKKKGRPAKRAVAKPEESHSSWTAFLNSLPTRPRNALLRRYGKKFSSMDQWAEKLETENLLTITGMGETSAKKVQEALDAFYKAERT